MPISLSTSVNKVVFPFDTLVNMEYGLIRLIRDKYLESRDYFDIQVLNMDRDRIMKLLTDRVDKNPLSVAVNYYDDVKDDVDSLYNEIMMNSYLEVLKRAVPTKLIDLVKKMAGSNSSAVVHIMCDKKEQEIYLNRLFANDHLSYAIAWPDFEYTMYDTLFVKFSDDIEKLYGRNIEKKNIYISDIKYNIDPKTGELDVKPLFLYSMTNLISIYNIYC